MTVYIIDLGGQYTHVIWRTVRDLGFEGEIIQKDVELEKLKDPQAIILSGGPGSAPTGDFGIVNQILQKSEQEGYIPVLGICLGHQIIAHQFGGTVEKGEHAEYGTMEIVVDEKGVLFEGVSEKFNAWVSHFDEVKKIPKNFISLAHSKICNVEAMRHKTKLIFGVQFHPEVWHTENGEKILSNFLKLIKGAHNKKNRT